MDNKIKLPDWFESFLIVIVQQWWNILSCLCCCSVPKKVVKLQISNHGNSKVEGEILDWLIRECGNTANNYSSLY